MKIGVIGNGQLGRMLALNGYPLGHQFGFVGRSNNQSASLIGHQFSQDDFKSWVDFFDVITYESENTDVEMLKQINPSVMVYPSEKSLFISQNRAREKALFDQLNIPCAPYQIVNSQADLENAIANIGTPAILKTRAEGYDGKGQFSLNNVNQIQQAWASMGGVACILEGFVDFKRELSLIAVRGIDKQCRFYPLVENAHHQGILRLTKVPAENIHATLQKAAENYMQTLLDAMNHIGVLTIELFETDKGLLVNEMAPRVHNSGHWSIEGAHTSQFENHVRAITNMPLGDSSLIHPFCAMVNIVSEVGAIDRVLKMPNAHLHLYDKTPRKNRKLGHITITANSQQQLNNDLKQLRDFLPSLF